MGLPINTPSPETAQYMPVRVPMTLIEGQSSGMMAPGRATMTLDTNPQKTDQTTMAAVLRTDIHAKSRIAQAPSAKVVSSSGPARAAAKPATIRPMVEAPLTIANR